MAVLVDAAITDPGRVPWVQLDAATGEVVGTTSYYGISEAAETVAIGWTMVAPARWRSAVNTEAKLLLLERAFDTLGAGRVEFHADIRNTRSQAAIERIGGVREGVHRRHKRRADGTWRDSVVYAITVDDWPRVRNRLVTRLAAGHTEAHAGRH
jgi:RimJ/RimL family protein N-acetyltransferase